MDGEWLDVVVVAIEPDDQSPVADLNGFTAE